MVFCFILFCQEFSPQPMPEMKGDCGQFSLDLSREFQIWREKPVDIAAEEGFEKAPTLPTDIRLHVSLHQMDRVDYLSPPPVKRGFKGTFGGMVKVFVETPGYYRFCLGTKAWVDLVDGATGTLMKEDSFEMQAQCERIFKVVVFLLEANKEYALQIASAPSSRAEALITLQAEK